MDPFDFHSPTRIVFGPGSLDRLPDLARDLGFHRTLLVADRGLLATGHVDRAARLLEQGGIAVFPFHDFDANPDSAMIEAGWTGRFNPRRFDAAGALEVYQWAF